jgi:hypothetical protein
MYSSGTGIRERTQKIAFRFYAAVVLTAFIICMAGCGGSSTSNPVPEEVFNYSLPLHIGTSWTYLHFFAALPKDSLSQISDITPDTVIWKIVGSDTISGALCAIMASVRKSGTDTVFGAYYCAQDTGLYRWSMDTAFSGQQLLKCVSRGQFRKYAELIVPAFTSDSASCAYTDGKGQLVTRHATLDNKQDSSITVTTSIDGQRSCTEHYAASGLISRVFARDRFYDDLRNDTVVTIDSLTLSR